MKKNQMNALIDQTLAERIQLLVNDPGFPALEQGTNLGPKELVRGLWKDNGWEPVVQPWYLMRFWATASILGLALHINEHSGDSVCLMVLREFSIGFWDREQALLSLREDELFFRFHTFAALFELGKPMLQEIAEEALEMVESSDLIEIDYRFWQITQGLAA
ncbi:hypothetical protein [Pseudoclavibacter terrae]|uniref:hypothetical protein n=1 Tax=Pseudoclavibacter terrae TaxID=1530195 RepID=UPI002330FC0F|nr:hypothetical protein [Pseudoclavibacter terrae]